MSSSQERFARLKKLLLAAREQPIAARAAFLRQQTDDEVLIAEALDLLGREDSAPALLDAGVLSARPSVAVPDRIGPYFIEGILGEGGMGVVYRARQEEPIQRQVALKLIRWGMHHESVVRRFDQERRTLALMDHPHIATVLDAGTDEAGHPWFVMPLVEGLPLLEFCDTERLPIGERLRLFEDICRAVHHAHGRGVLHRDLKPGNILVRRVNGLPVPVIIDFGIAKALQHDDTNEDLTREGQQIGTPAYMSPEQLSGEENQIDARSDVYSLGIILYELLAGRHPYGEDGVRDPGSAPQAPSTAVTDPATGELAALRGVSTRELRRRLRGDIDTICLMAVRAEPERRYASAAHLADDLRRYRDGHPVDARADSWTYRVGKFAGRHPAATAVSVMALVAVLAGSVGLVWHARSLQTERDRARVAEADAVRELETSKAVVAFFEEMFELARPDLGGQADLTAIEMVDLGADAVPARLEGEPWLQAELYRVLGVVDHALSRNDKSAEVLQRALAANGSITGREPPVVHLQRAQILSEYGVVQHDLGLYAAAVLTHREALQEYDASGIADSLAVATCLNGLGVSLQADAKLEESVAPTERALKLSEKYGPPEDPDIAWGWGSLGYINFQLGHLELAGEQFEHALELARALFDGDHFDLAQHLNNLGGFYQRMGRFAEAERLLDENLAMNQRMFATEPHGSLSRAYQNLAGLYLDTGRAAEAVELLDAGYPVSVAALGARHPRTGRHLASRALAKATAGDAIGARSDLELATSIIEDALPDGNRDRESFYLTRGRTLTLLGDTDAAISDLERWQAWTREHFPEHHHERAEVALRLGEAQLAAGHPELARPLFESALAGFTASYGPDHPRTQLARTDLAAIDHPGD